MHTRRALFGGAAAVISTAVYCDTASGAFFSWARGTWSGLPVLYGDGEHDDVPALQAIADSKPYRVSKKFKAFERDGFIANATLRINSILNVPEPSPLFLMSCQIVFGNELNEGKACIRFAADYSPHMSACYLENAAPSTPRNFGMIQLGTNVYEMS